MPKLTRPDTSTLDRRLFYADIRSFGGEATQLYCAGRSTMNDGGVGLFYLDEEDKTSLDNDGSTLVDIKGRRWKRNLSCGINIAWWLDSDEEDAAIGFQKAIDAYPYSTIYVPYKKDGYVFKSTIKEPRSASFHLVGNKGLQVNEQLLMLAHLDGAVFECDADNTTFTKYEGFRFESNRDLYPRARAIHNKGFWVHGALHSITVKNFNADALEFNGYNCCNFNNILIQFNNGLGLKCTTGATNVFDNIVGDNNLGGVMETSGAANVYRALYSEDCCKSNVTSGMTNPEFKFSGDAPVITGMSLNSFEGNTTPPIKLDLCRNMTAINVVNKSTKLPSYPHEFELTNQDSSLTLINSSDIRIGGSKHNTITIDAGYSTGKRPKILVGEGQRNIAVNAPIGFVSFDGTGDVTLLSASGVSRVSRVNSEVGTYDILFTTEVGSSGALCISGMASRDIPQGAIIVSEVASGRTNNQIRIKTERFDGQAQDCNRVSVVIYGVPA